MFICFYVSIGEIWSSFLSLLPAQTLLFRISFLFNSNHSPRLFISVFSAQLLPCRCSIIKKTKWRTKFYLNLCFSTFLSLQPSFLNIFSIILLGFFVIYSVFPSFCSCSLEFKASIKSEWKCCCFRKPFCKNLTSNSTQFNSIKNEVLFVLFEIWGKIETYY